MSKGSEVTRRTYLREPGYLVAEWDRRPWSLFVQWQRGWYATLSFSAPLLGEVSVRRRAWGEIDRIEAASAAPIRVE